AEHRVEKFAVEIAIPLAGVGLDPDYVPENVGNDAFGRRMKARNLNLLLISPSIPDECMTIAGGGPRPEIDVVDCAVRRLLLGAAERRGRSPILRARRLNLQSCGDRNCA